MAAVQSVVTPQAPIKSAPHVAASLDTEALFGETVTVHECENGFSHVEFLPVSEYPFGASWGYQVTGYYAPTYRHGTPEDFSALISSIQSAGIGVIIDWVPAHFPSDEFALSRFDGTCLFEHEDPRQGQHAEWGTLCYNYGKPEVRSFLSGSAITWLDRFGVDGFRVDAVASMLYLDYGRRDNEWIPNKDGGNYNLEAIDFLKQFNQACLTLEEVNLRFPGQNVISIQNITETKKLLSC